MRGEKNGFSEDFLNAIVDDEYPVEEKAELITRVMEDTEVSATYCELQRVKVMVKAAYNTPPGVPAGRGSTNRKRLPGLASIGIVASLFLAVILAGLFVSGQEPRMVLLDPLGYGSRPAQATDDAARIVFHVNSSVIGRADELLDDIEGVLRDYENQHQKLRVEVVANGDGLGLLRTKLSTQQERLTELSQQFPTLTFVACMNTIERLRVEEGVIVELVPEAEVTDSGVAYVVKRQQQGWIYIQV